MSAVLKIDYVSPSALETSGECLRKWAYTKIDRVPKKQNAAAGLGGDVHSEHERWLGQGVPYNTGTRAGELAAATLHMLPAPFVAKIETEFSFLWRGIVFGGKADAHWLEGTYAVALDHKTTGNFAWAKLTKEELIAHPQAVIYAMYLMLEYGVEWVHLRWNYVLTSSKSSIIPTKASWHWVHRSEIEKALDSWIDQAQLLHEVIAAANDPIVRLRAKHVPYNSQACSNYGGCQFRDNGMCRRDEGPSAGRLLMAQSGMSEALRARLAAGKATAAAETQAQPQQYAPPPVAPPQQYAPPPPMAPPIGAGVPGVAIAAGGVAQYAPPPPQYAPQAPAAAFPPPASNGQIPGQHYGAAVNPPEQALPAPPQAAVAPPPAAPAAPARRGRKPKAAAGAPGAAPEEELELRKKLALALATNRSVLVPEEVSPLIDAFVAAVFGDAQ